MLVVLETSSVVSISVALAVADLAAMSLVGRSALATGRLMLDFDRDHSASDSRHSAGAAEMKRTDLDLTVSGPL